MDGLSIETIPQWLIQWGPAGVATLLIYVVEGKLRSRWDSLKGSERRMCAWLYLGNWVLIAAMLLMVSSSWLVNSGKNKVLMSGIVTDLNTELKVNNSIRTLYTRNQSSLQNTKNVHWHYSGDKLPAQFDIRIEDHRIFDFYDYQLPLDKIDDLRNVHLSYQQNKLWLRTQSGMIELVVINSAAGELTLSSNSDRVSHFSLFNQAHAAEKVDIKVVMEALENNDSYVRQLASQHLVENMVSLTPLVEEAILSSDTSLAKQLGLVTALAKASSSDLGLKGKWHLTRAAELKITEFAFSDNPVLAAQAKRFLIRNVTDQTFDALKSQCVLSELEGTPKARRCAYLLFDASYNLAIAQWIGSQYFSQQDELIEVQTAINLLNNHSDLWRLAAAERQVQFAKNDYGIALLSHEKAKLYQAKGDTVNQLKYQRKARNHFGKLIDFIGKYKESDYDYPHHLKQANCYISKPSQACFDLHVKQ